MSVDAIGLSSELLKAVKKYTTLAARFQKSSLYNHWLEEADRLLEKAKKIKGKPKQIAQTVKEGAGVTDEECAEVGERVDPETNKLDFSKLAGLNKIKEILRRTIKWSLKEKEKMVLWPGIMILHTEESATEG